MKDCKHEFNTWSSCESCGLDMKEYLEQLEQKLKIAVEALENLHDITSCIFSFRTNIAEIALKQIGEIK
jgi:tRNA/tmRNA/rRNA uracil-C5-methylase (TrmA/RlmC/RlmD family)